MNMEFFVRADDAMGPKLCPRCGAELMVVDTENCRRAVCQCGQYEWIHIFEVPVKQQLEYNFQIQRMFKASE